MSEENKKELEEVKQSDDAILEDIEEIKEEKRKEANKPKKKKWYKYILYLTLILVITIVVLAISLTQGSGSYEYNDAGEIIYEYKVYQLLPSVFSQLFKGNKYTWFFIGFIGAIIILYLLNSLSLWLYARLYTKKYKYHQAVANYMIGVFYSNITPGSSGGQFAQAFTFSRQGIPVSSGASILVMSFIVYQSVLVVSGLFSMIKINDVLAIDVISLNIGEMKFPIPVTVFIILGYLLNAFVILLLFLMSYSKKFHNFVLTHGINFFAKLHLIKNPEKKKESLRLQVENFRVELRRLQSNIPFTILVVLLTFITLYINNSLPVICGYALNGFNESDYNVVSFLDNTLSSFCYMNFHQMMTGLVPIPGSAGVSEFVFQKLFTVSSGENIGFFSNPDFNYSGLNGLMLLWRFGTFYIPFLFCGFVAALYKSRGIDREERFYSIDNTRQTFVNIQTETLEERRMTSIIVIQETEEKRKKFKEKFSRKKKNNNKKEDK